MWAYFSMFIFWRLQSGRRCSSTNRSTSITARLTPHPSSWWSAHRYTRSDCKMFTFKYLKLQMESQLCLSFHHFVVNTCWSWTLAEWGRSLEELHLCCNRNIHLNYENNTYSSAAFKPAVDWSYKENAARCFYPKAGEKSLQYLICYFFEKKKWTDISQV